MQPDADPPPTTLPAHAGQTLGATASVEPATPAAPVASHAGSSEWSPRQHLLFLMLWWAIIVVYYVAFTSPLLRNSKDWLTVDMIYAARYPVLAAGLLGAISAERKRVLWFFVSAAGALCVLLLALVLMAAIRSALGA